MTQEEFEKRMSVLKGKRMAIEREIKNLQNEYLSSYPIQPNDIRMSNKGEYTPFLCLCDSKWHQKSG